MADLLGIERLFMHEEQHPQSGDLYNTPQIALAYAFFWPRSARKGLRGLIWPGG
jgi:hypothetical protein